MRDSNILLTEIIGWLREFLKHPKLYGHTPYSAEAILTSTVDIARAIERDSSLLQSQKDVSACITELTRDVPASRSQAVFLCEETAMPERGASHQLLQTRGAELCARMLAAWNDPLCVHPDWV